MLRLGILRLTVRKAILRLYKNHSRGQHIRCKLCIMACTGVNILMGNTAFLCCRFHIAYQLLIPVNCIPIPRLFYLAGTAVPFFIGTALDNCQNLFQNLGIFMSCIEGKVYEIRYTGVYARVANDLTSGIHQITVTQLIDLLMQIAQCLSAA